MKNVSNIKNCYGCGLCATVCSRNIINIELNKDGFYVPQITDIDKCTECGLCLNVCSYSHNETAIKVDETKIHSWASWSKNSQIQRECSSGGTGYEIAKQLIEQGYKLCACRYNADKQRAEHYIATTAHDALQSMGSKYIQSYTVDGIKAINRKEKYVVTGTPCQIDSFRRYIQRFKIEDNFILIDFFCHCVPSMWAWNKYAEMVQKKVGKIKNATWRNKETGWHDSWCMNIKGDKEYNSRLSQGDIFYHLFLGDYCLNPACSKDCKFKYDKSSADIRIGDLWGKTYKDNNKGVTALVAFTDKGKNVVESLNEVTLVEHPFDVVAEGQMKDNAKIAPTYPIVMWFLRSNFTLDSFVWKAIHFTNKVVLKLKLIAKKFV